ncbi:four helix bundle protein [Candidatus Beckwithbacteria bacterium]|nr:four helix bundle protein [Candidatus Beckwithbacteria bacterium]
MDKIKSFTDLIAWKEGYNFVLNLYKITENFPEREAFGLTSQLRRASVSITSNLAEGFGRKGKKNQLL